MAAQSLQEQETLANTLLDNGKGAEAVNAFQSLIALNPPNTDWLYYQLGKAYSLDKKWPKAAGSFMQALKLNPQLAIAAVAFGDTSVAMKAYEEAEKAYLHALKFKNIHPELAQSYLRLGEILTNNKQYEFALHAYKNTLDLDKNLRPQLLETYKALGELLNQENKTELAQQVTKRANTIEEEIVAEKAVDEIDENELLLLQLHQTQEELERLFFKNDELEKVNAEKQKQMESLEKANAEKQKQMESLENANIEKQKQLERANAETTKKLTQMISKRDEQARLISEQQAQLTLLTNSHAETTVNLAKTTSQLSRLITKNDEPTSNSSPYAHNRTLTEKLNQRIRAFLIDVLHKEDVKPSYVDYLALKAVEIEKGSIGRLATTVQDAVIRQAVAESITDKHLGILEIGALYGVNLAILYNHCIPYFDSMKMICLDPFDGYYGKPMDQQLGIPVTSKLFRRNMQSANIPTDSYTLIQRYSTDEEAITQASQEKITLLIIDGDHTYEGIKFDYQNYLPLLQPNGLLIVDDYNAKEWPGVQEYVDQVIKRDDTCEFIGSFSRTAIFRKKA
ncbi:class I SAM-dependent methyltransferase [Candidatus Albibeggiatoa sp. nov. BB20]|uniref:class I SAM-dependent methyltransferase n=1 Tax=Candidatus Albibeggiatoa sp. nov. BB20 TaxID=3162723 RepID=UPI0033653473